MRFPQFKKGFTLHHFLRNLFARSTSTKNGAGFTVIELLISISIIVILSAIVFINYKEGQKRLTLERAAYKLAQDIRGVQAKAGEELTDCIGVTGYQYGYGIYFTTSQKYEYILFADCDGDNIYDGGNEELSKIKLEKEKGIEIQSFFPVASRLDIVFVPPDPTVYINNNDPSLIANIILKIIDISSSKTITVNKAGLIDIY